MLGSLTSTVVEVIASVAVTGASPTACVTARCPGGLPAVRPVRTRLLEETVL